MHFKQPPSKTLQHAKNSVPSEHIEGLIERVTFHSEESGFSVLRVKVRGQRELLTVVGHTACVHAGEYVSCEGIWFNDKQHGAQFKAQQLKVIPPSTVEGIEKYLGSGMVKGIGPHFAKKLVQSFGEAVFDIIEHNPERLLELDGIGPKRKQQVTTAWAEQKAIRHIMVFLQSHGVGTARAVRIYKTYQDNAIANIQANPYCLAQDIHGIGFKTADSLAMRLGISTDSPLRAAAGLNYVLLTLCEQGHCAVPPDVLITQSQQLLEIDSSILNTALQTALKEATLMQSIFDETTWIYPKTIYYAEVGLAKQVKNFKQRPCPWGMLSLDLAIPWVQQKLHITLSDSQQSALKLALKQSFNIITGGPGVGKTTLIRSIITLLEAKHMQIALAAPTGRAAKRLAESTQLTAKTIHRLLDIDPKSGHFKHNEDNPLQIDVLIVDEASMLDIHLAYQLFKAIPKHAALILVGDIDQLPSVGPGTVLADLIHCQQVPTVRLTEIFRQAKHSQIIDNAHRINRGQLPRSNNKNNSDFYWIQTETPEATHQTLLRCVTERIPQYLNCDAIQDIQVLTPMNRGGLGSHSLNIALQQALNPYTKQKISRYGQTFAPQDKVIQILNNYDKDVFNGDIGCINQIDPELQTLTIRFDKRDVIYDWNELDEIRLAYAISIHKSQGSEFPVVVLPLAMQHYMLLARNLLYTGVTRGKQLVVLIGSKKAIGLAVHNHQTAQRWTHLNNRLTA